MNIEKELINIQLNQLFTWGMLIFIVGASLNFMVISANGYRMPIKSSEKINNSGWFSYQDKNEIKLWLLSDWIGSENYILFSIGDLLLFTGFFILFSSLYKTLSINRKYKKKQTSIK